jgi:RNA polymerase sigma-70 factor (ECF subfamily)
VDHQNLLAARSGDRAALATLLRALQDSWFRFCLALLRNADQARDATQETGLRFIRTFGTFRGDSQLQTWSLGIALNVVREMRRKNRPLPDEGHAFREAVRSEAECPSEAVALSEQRARLHAVLDDLPERQREAVVLRFFEELSVEDTARAMDCAEGTVKATVHQALRSLRSKLTERPVKK